MVGVDIEPALVAQLVADAGGTPGTLPMLQYALTRLFDDRGVQVDKTYQLNFGGNTDFQFDGNPEFFYSPDTEVKGPQWDAVDGGFTTQ